MEIVAKEKESNRKDNIKNTLAKERDRRDKENASKQEVITCLKDEETQAIFGTVENQLKVVFDH
jgi:hypothetical protein